MVSLSDVPTSLPFVARKFFTIDLRGLHAALTARAARGRRGEQDVLRSALVAALGLACKPSNKPCRDLRYGSGSAGVDAAVRAMIPGRLAGYFTSRFDAPTNSSGKVCAAASRHAHKRIRSPAAPISC